MNVARTTVSWLLCSLSLTGVQAAKPPPAPQQFQQEIARHREIQQNLPAGQIQCMELGTKTPPRLLINGRWLEWRDHSWELNDPLNANIETSFSFLDSSGHWVVVPLPARSIRQIVRLGSTNYLSTGTDLYLAYSNRLQSLGWPSPAPIHQFTVSPEGEVFTASSLGVHHFGPRGWNPIRILDTVGRQWAAENALGIAFDSKNRLWVASLAGIAFREGNSWRFFEGKDGLPWNEFTGIWPAPDGEVWFGTHRGAIRWDGSDFHYRQGLAWLPNDDIRRMAVSSNGDAWFGTTNGVGWIERRSMTFAEKARVYESEIEQYIQRTPFGYVSEASLRVPGDKSSHQNHDSDNDGLWTSMWGAGECFAVAATGDPEARRRAKKAFEALRFLQKVTQGGTPQPPKGYIARTIRSVELPDPNEGRFQSDIEGQKHDALWKAYEPRWPKSADGKWYWKSDTSSDELDGHYFFYALYYEFVADTEAERERVREVVRDITDHMLQFDGILTDHDGKPTRWGIYSPQYLNRSPNWWPERGLNSLSWLTYLTTAHSITGDPKYAAAIRELVDKHGYAHNAMYSKVQHGPGSGNQSDDEMAFMCYYTLLRHSKDDALKAMIRYSFFRYWANEAPELNPFFNFAYAAIGLDQTVTNPFGTFSISPWPGWHEDSIATLRGFSIDRIGWGHQNSHRLDIVWLPRQKGQDLYDPRPHRRGHRTNGKVLPVENRHFNHWNTDPWDLDYGGGGHELASGTVFLLPYYMGLYHGFIQKP